MTTLKFDKTKVIEVLKKNRDTHAAEAKAAKEGYHKALLKALSKLRSQIRKGEPFDVVGNLGIQTPADYTRNYDLVIEMLELTSEVEVQLTPQEYNKYMKDDWEWAAHAKLVNSTYLGKLP